MEKAWELDADGVFKNPVEGSAGMCSVRGCAAGAISGWAADRTDP